MDFEDFYTMVANELPDNCNIAEIGVADGRSALFLAYRLRSIGKSFNLYMIDNCDYGKEEQRHTITGNIILSGIRNIRFLEMSSLDASCKFPDGLFDFVFIDASHLYEETKADVRLWSHKVKDGGILSGHDYYCCEGVKAAVDEIIPSEILHLEQTSKGYGVWWIVKTHKLRLNNDTR